MSNRSQMPGLVRIGAAVWWRTAGWAAGTSVRVGSRLMRVVSGSSDGVVKPRVPRPTSGAARPRPAKPAGSAEAAAAASTLRDRGAELLRLSADVHFEEEAHPAYARILSELAPDEVRILRLLALEGPQPAVDVRSGPRALNVISELVAPGLSMIGAEAGCRLAERVPAYLNNLNRLGLVWFSREPVKNPLGYQVLEAQPDVIGAMRGAGRAHTVRRSIHLTPFGEDFCRLCLPIHTA